MDQFRLVAVICNGLLATRADTQVRPDKIRLLSTA